MSRLPLLEARVSALEKHRCCSLKSKINLGADGESRISGGTAVDMIRLKSDSVLAALTVGTTADGTDVLTSTATVAGWNTFIVNAFSESDYKLYFGGITSTSTIIIYKR